MAYMNQISGSTHYVEFDLTTDDSQRQIWSNKDILEMANDEAYIRSIAHGKVKVSISLDKFASINTTEGGDAFANREALETFLYQNTGQ